jgi:hypothetical protein
MIHKGHRRKNRGFMYLSLREGRSSSHANSLPRRFERVVGFSWIEGRAEGPPQKQGIQLLFLPLLDLV